VVGNLSGDYAFFDGPHRNTGLGNTFGKPRGSLRSAPAEYRKKGTGTMKLPEANKFAYQTTESRPPVPKRNEQPIHGLKSAKNYIVANAVEVILKAPKTLPAPVNHLAKTTYGRVPKYLNTIKQEIDDEYETLRTLHQEQVDEEDQKRYLLSAQEIKELRAGLKRKWESVNREYQTVTHISKVDTLGLKRKKEGCEKELAQIEKDMALLDKAYVFVDTEA
jgi:hypothetical protein